jgi:hypothetical protein
MAWVLPAGVLLLAQAAMAQVQPHRAEYVLRLGSAINAPRVGTAVQDLTLDCDGWHLRRDVKGEVPISASWKFSLVSTLDSDEGRSGDELSFRAVQVQNGAERETHGKVTRSSSDGALRADIVSPDGPARIQLPPLTQMPVATFGTIIGKLRAGAGRFDTVAFDAQSSGDAFRVDVTQIDARAIRRRPPSDKPIAVPGRSWPVSIAFTSRAKEQKPLFAFSAQLYETGVLDHVTVETDVVTIAADLKTLDMHPAPSCR